MKQLLTAVLLLATFNAVADVELSEITNGDVADAEVVMGNFNALKNEIESLPAPPSDCGFDQIIRWDGSAWVCADSVRRPAVKEVLRSIGWGYSLQSGPTPQCCDPIGDGSFDGPSCAPIEENPGQVCTNGRNPVQRECTSTVSTYYCASRIEYCDGAECDGVPSCKYDEAPCGFGLTGGGAVTCDLDSECSVAGLDGIVYGVANTQLCKAGAACRGSTSTGDSTLYMYCEAGSACGGTAYTGSSFLAMVCANGSTCTGESRTGNAIVVQACEDGANCSCTAGELNSQCLSGDYANYPWPQ